jgi:hypothetical protein
LDDADETAGKATGEQEQDEIKWLNEGVQTEKIDCTA